MPSNIDATLPVAGNPTTGSVRNNFNIAKTEITALQTLATTYGMTPTVSSLTVPTGVIHLGTIGANINLSGGGHKGQVLQVATDGLTITYAPGVIVLLSNLMLYVNKSSGADTNSGLSPAAAFKTVFTAVIAASQYKLNGFQLTIQIADGDYSADSNTISTAPAGAGNFVIQGNLTNPANVNLGYLSVTAFSPSVKIVLSCLTVSNSPGTALYLKYTTIFYHNLVVDGLIGVSMYASNLYPFSSGSALTMPTSTPSVLLSLSNRSDAVVSPSINLPAPANFSTGMVLVEGASFADLTGCIVTGAYSGPQYTLQRYSSSTIRLGDNTYVSDSSPQTVLDATNGLFLG